MGVREARVQNHPPVAPPSVPLHKVRRLPRAACAVQGAKEARRSPDRPRFGRALWVQFHVKTDALGISQSEPVTSRWSRRGLCPPWASRKQGSQALAWGGSSRRCGSEQLYSHGLRDETALGRTVGPGEASRDNVGGEWMDVRCRNTSPVQTPGAVRALGVAGQGRETVPPSFDDSLSP